MSDEDYTKEEKNNVISKKDLSEKRRSSIGSADEKPPERPARKKQFKTLQKIRRASSANIMNAFNLSSNKTEAPGKLLRKHNIFINVLVYFKLLTICYKKLVIILKFLFNNTSFKAKFFKSNYQLKITFQIIFMNRG